MVNGIHQKTGLANRNEVLKLYQELKKKQKELGRESMMGFVRYTKTDYDVQWFHKLICAYLDMLERGEIKKLMIFIPPQHGDRS
jgi:hypothetical protein